MHTLHLYFRLFRKTVGSSMVNILKNGPLSDGVGSFGVCCCCLWLTFADSTQVR